ncbi:hypothetical protein PAXRUDRAFT_826549 [Paxillus rubicundulus Ve08.2h10]|uniref:Unplaced genomic scaffold scaffold_193, whole genome shotgun sequence n=1 Tax=Paxillus rubicundulus Ve08.2h10 TaxID=930991 RepID=A0A0D0DRV9_9AGAM|nr:hypothetical protein PAXRUDRAFT_826549 [Paxillus rubicundulus Ve08.2h10]
MCARNKRAGSCDARRLAFVSEMPVRSKFSCETSQTKNRYGNFQSIGNSVWIFCDLDLSAEQAATVSYLTDHASGGSFVLRHPL